MQVRRTNPDAVRSDLNKRSLVQDIALIVEAGEKLVPTLKNCGDPIKEKLYKVLANNIDPQDSRASILESFIANAKVILYSNNNDLKSAFHSLFKQMCSEAGLNSNTAEYLLQALINKQYLKVNSYISQAAGLRPQIQSTRDLGRKLAF